MPPTAAAGDELLLAPDRALGERISDAVLMREIAGCAGQGDELLPFSESAGDWIQPQTGAAISRATLRPGR